MQIGYLFLGIVSLIMVFYGAKWLLRFKTVASFPKGEVKKQIQLKKPGTYAICLKGNTFTVPSIYKFGVTSDVSGRTVPVKYNLLNWSFRKNWITHVEYAIFKSVEAGLHNVEILNPKFDDSHPMGKELIHVKESVPLYKKFLAIIFLCFGVNGSFWGIALFLNPNLLA